MQGMYSRDYVKEVNRKWGGESRPGGGKTIEVCIPDQDMQLG